MNKINKIGLVAFLLLAIWGSAESQVTKTKFEMVFDETTCEYSMYLHVLEGEAVEFIERLPFNFGIALIIPVESSATLVESVIPTSNAWNLSNVGAASGGDLDKTFVLVSHPAGSLYAYPEMYPGDEILLFKFTVTGDVQGVKGLRPYDNSMDNPGGGGVYGTSFLLGGVVNSHEGFLPTQFASTYAEATGPSFIYVDKQTTLAPSGGTWTQTNAAVTSFDQSTNLVTGLSEGRSLFTYTPASGCVTSAVVTVVPDTATTKPASIGEAVADLAVKFGVYGTNDGILIPRMTENQRLCIVGPAAGLILYQINEDAGFFYYNGQAWKRLTNTLSEGTASYQGGGSSSSTASMNGDDQMQELLKKQAELLQKYEEQSKELKDLADKVSGME